MNPIHTADIVRLRSLYETIFQWEDVKSAPQPSEAERLHIDGAGIFWREGATIYRTQYGGFEFIEFPSEAVAEAVLEFIGDHFT